MWAEFWLAALVGAIFVFVPAFAILRALGFSRVVSAAGAPVVSLLFYSLLAIVYAKVGVFTTGWNLFIPLAAIAIIATAVAFAVSQGRSAASLPSGSPAREMGKSLWTQETWLILLYVALGIIVTSYIFLGALTTPDSTSYAYDDQSHLGTLRSFLERGNYSSLSVNYEYDVGGSDGYYPAAWHLLAASIASITGAANYVAANAALFACCALIYPLCCLALLRRLFRGNLAMQVVGSFLALTFASFPWEFIAYGRLVANLLAFCFVPLMLLCTMMMLAHGAPRAQRVRFGVLLFASFVLSVFTQPSVCFTWLFFSVPFVMHVIWTLRAKDGSEVPVKRRVLRVALFCIAVVVFLIGCYMLPFLWSLTRFKWDAPLTVPLAIADVVLQGSPHGPYSLILAVLVVVGIVAALRKRELRWLVLLFAILAFMYVIDAGTNLRLKNYLTGWWYTDSHRVLAMFAIASYPLAVLGLGTIATAAFRKIDSKRLRAFLGTLLAVLVSAATLVPSFSLGSWQVTTPAGYLHGFIEGSYNVSVPDEYALLSAPEREFVKKAAEITGDDIVFNIPLDGSAFAYQASGMKVYKRWVFDGVSSDVNMRLLQRGLADIESNSSVARALDKIGAKYVLMLDQGHEPFHYLWPEYSAGNWSGVLSIDEDTPGFELVMSEGDMKLYRITHSDQGAEQ